MKTKLILLLLLFLNTTFSEAKIFQNTDEDSKFMKVESAKEQSRPYWIQVKKDVPVKQYFGFIDSVVTKLDTLVPYHLTEHLLVRANPWIIETLAETDYYRMKAKDTFVYDQKEMIILKKTDSILIPSSAAAESLNKIIENTWIDINIPEFKLRIYNDSILLYSILIRVGQNRQRYLKMGDRETDLRTKTGIGSIVRHERNPSFYNPVNGKQFYLTTRDDKKVTVMPQVPWIETEINGLRDGQMIHPTTNPETLGKAYSNGCIGMGEADAWIIYYHAPIKTKVVIRYDLKIKGSDGKEHLLNNIYNY